MPKNKKIAPPISVSMLIKTRFDPMARASKSGNFRYPSDDVALGMESRPSDMLEAFKDQAMEIGMKFTDAQLAQIYSSLKPKLDTPEEVK